MYQTKIRRLAQFDWILLNKNMLIVCFNGTDSKTGVQWHSPPKVNPNSQMRSCLPQRYRLVTITQVKSQFEFKKSISSQIYT